MELWTEDGLGLVIFWDMTPSRVRGVKCEGGAEMTEGSADVLREIRDTIRAQNRQLHCLNAMLGRLIKLTAKEVYGGRSEESNEDLEVEAEVGAEVGAKMEEYATRA